MLSENKEELIMSKHKAISKKARIALYEKYNHRCAYCGCEMEYKDMQVDHIKSVYCNNDIAQTMSEEEMYSEINFLPACRQCNLYKSTFTIEEFRKRLQDVMMKNLKKDFKYRMAVKYGLIEETNKNVKFHFEEISDEQTKK